MKRLDKSIWILFVFMEMAAEAAAPPASRAPEFSIWDHGKKCYEELGVPVPAFSCTDPNATVVPVTRNGVTVKEGDPPGNGRCDIPADGSSSCYPGSRVLKFVDQVSRNGRTEKIVTMIICRRRQNGPPSSKLFGDIAIIQHNESINKTCWFNVLGERDSTNVPSPYQPDVPRDRNQEAEKYWGKTPTSLNCIHCHDNQLLIRTPWISQLNAMEGGGYTRSGGSGPYRVGGGNALPDYSKKGMTCTAGGGHFEAWNKTLPTLIRINTQAFKSYQSAQGIPILPNTAQPSLCTSCHYLGQGKENGKSCNLARDSFGETNRGSYLSAHGARFPNSYWMPPSDRWPSQLREVEELPDSRLLLLSPTLSLARAAGQATVRNAYARGFKAYFKPAIDAVKFCCDLRNIEKTQLVGGRPTKICQGPPFPRYPNAQNPCDAPPEGAATAGRGKPVPAHSDEPGENPGSAK